MQFSQDLDERLLADVSVVRGLHELGESPLAFWSAVVGRLAEPGLTAALAQQRWEQLHAAGHDEKGLPRPVRGRVWWWGM